MLVFVSHTCVMCHTFHLHDRLDRGSVLIVEIDQDIVKPTLSNMSFEDCMLEAIVRPKLARLSPSHLAVRHEYRWSPDVRPRHVANHAATTVAAEAHPARC